MKYIIAGYGKLHAMHTLNIKIDSRSMVIYSFDMKISLPATVYIYILYYQFIV